MIESGVVTTTVLVAMLPMVMLLLAVSAFGKEMEAFTDHGVAADVSRSRGAAATVDGEGRRVVLVWLYDHCACTSMLVIDAVTGKTQQIPVERSIADAPFAVLLSSRNLWYSQFGDRFYEFDPATLSFSFVGDTPSRCAMSMTEDASGTIWAALYPGSHLVSFNPETQELLSHGALNEETWPQYPSDLATDDQGWVYTGIGNTTCQVAGFNTATGHVRHYVADENRVQGSGRVFVGTDGKVYAHAPGWGWHVLAGGEAAPIDEPLVKRAPAKTAAQESVFSDFPDGSQVAELDVPERLLRVQEADGTVRELAFEYESEGSGILSIVLGPDGAMYGSTGHPLRVYRFDPLTGTFTHHGLRGEMGHLNAMAVQRDLLFGALYGGGVLYQYDVGRPWAPGDKQASNPRALGGSDPAITRPHALLAHPDGRHLTMGGTPDYGHTGGGLFIYDLEAGSGQVLSHEQLLQDHSTLSLVALPDGNLLGGTTVAPGTGGQAKATEAELYLFDWASRQVVWRKALIPGTTGITDLLPAPDGLVYGIAANSTFFVFDPETRSLVHEESLSSYGPPAGAQGPRIMSLGPDGVIYVLFAKAVVTVEPGTFRHRKLADSPVSIEAGVVLREGRIYFTSGSHLWSYAIPGL